MSTLSTFLGPQLDFDDTCRNCVDTCGVGGKCTGDACTCVGDFSPPDCGRWLSRAEEEEGNPSRISSIVMLLQLSRAMRTVMEMALSY